MALLAALDAAPLFAAIVCGGDGPARSRAPEPITRALAPMGVSPRDAWVVGDGVQGRRRREGRRRDEHHAVLGGFPRRRRSCGRPGPTR